MSMIERVAKALEDVTDKGFATWEEAARAAIEAMREPTTPMGVAGSRWSHFPYEGWQAMIDVALAP